MSLDLQVCSRARISRDARFDGKFFIGVLTSGVYCRPICPARTPKERNVRYFPSAAAAAEAGFRPCLRCRPECSPGTPAWVGTSSTVTRALRLISESGLEEGGIEALAERLGVGGRHLRRLFLRHLGASPNAVVQTRRLHFAKKLIDETSLPMSEIALASGFGSVRRFNAAIRKTYKRTPTHIRRVARQKIELPSNEYQFLLRYRPPYHWAQMMSFLATRAIPGVEIVDSGTYRRSISLGGHDGSFEASHDASVNGIRVRIRVGDPCLLFSIIEKIRGLFDLNADLSEIVRCLRMDHELAALVDSLPGLRVPGCWDGFELAVRAILGQQVSVRAASTFAGRIASMFGRAISAGNGLTHIFPEASVLVDASLTQAGLTRARAETIRCLAKAVCDGTLSFERVDDTEVFRTQLCEIPGIGAWTAQYVSMRALREPDAFPWGDLGLMKALGVKNARDLERRSEVWRPWRAYAAMYVWCAAGRQNSQTSRFCERNTTEAPREQGASATM